MVTAYWLQGGGCGGDTFSFLSSESPNVLDLFDALDVSLLWHPSLSNGTAAEHDTLLDEILSKKRSLDILIFEGAAICGPDGSGRFDLKDGKPKISLIKDLAHVASYVVAVGTCASFGGFGAEKLIEAKGLQFTKKEKGGLLGKKFKSKSGLPVINLAGCPCHHDVISGAVSAIASGLSLELDEYQRPLEWFNTTVHQGCTRNEYHEYRVEESSFGEMGCLFFHMGCNGPLVPGPCNKVLWNQQSSKPRAGVPCFGCTDPEFPFQRPFFKTPNIEGVPISLPIGINRAHYLVYKTMAAAAAPEHLKKRTKKV
ncbi:MAG: NADH:ubiquinone oxidoreductase [Desulfobulbaceae bacterium]|nr:MAG: NADH:ubiquinone oxidoreductase [Desulfobulbaceae bacterium]